MREHHEIAQLTVTVADVIPSERAIRILMTREGPVQARAVETIESLLNEEVERRALTPTLRRHDLAYLIVRIAESFLYADIITGEPPDVAKVQQAIAALLSTSMDRPDKQIEGLARARARSPFARTSGLSATSGGQLE